MRANIATTNQKPILSEDMPQTVGLFLHNMILRGFVGPMMGNIF